MPSLVSYVWLSLKRGLGPYLSAELLRVMGSPEAVYAADDQAACAGVSPSAAAASRPAARQIDRRGRICY